MRSKGRIIKQTESEFGMPFLDVLAGFAEDGYTISAIAKILGYSNTLDLYRLVDRYGDRSIFPAGQNTALARQSREDRKGRCSDAQRAACRKASAANPEYQRVTWKGHTGTLADHARRLGIPLQTVYTRSYRRPGQLAYILATAYRYTPPPRGKGWQAFDFTIGRRAA